MDFTTRTPIQALLLLLLPRYSLYSLPCLVREYRSFIGSLITFFNIKICQETLEYQESEFYNTGFGFLLRKIQWTVHKTILLIVFLLLHN